VEKKMKVGIISIDWDFVFPDVLDYDWGHKETILFLEALWQFRVGQRNLVTGALAEEDVVVNEDRFSLLQTVVSIIFPISICIAESHASIVPFLDSFVKMNPFVKDMADGMEIWNFDAHHDLGYGTKDLECGNWTVHLDKILPISKYNVVYPAWRRETPEGFLGDKKPRFEYAYHYSDNRKVPVWVGRIAAPILLFVCRSGAWTPPWQDKRWVEFIKIIKMNHPSAFRNKSYADYALKARKFNMGKVKKVADKVAAMFKKSSSVYSTKMTDLVSIEEACVIVGAQLRLLSEGETVKHRSLEHSGVATIKFPAAKYEAVLDEKGRLFYDYSDGAAGIVEMIKELVRQYGKITMLKEHRVNHGVWSSWLDENITDVDVDSSIKVGKGRQI
jgi:hypothetical protein